ncbi:MAG: c-type cytochrome biogenesis protein CcsB [Jatrophihabitans sp.]
MSVNDGLAHLADGLFTAAIATYALAAFGYTAEYAFGGRGKIAATTPAALAAPDAEKVLIGSAGLSTAESLSDSAASNRDASTPKVEIVQDDPKDRSRRTEWIGRGAVAVTIIGFLVHLASVSIRGIAVDRVPWGNMYEFSAVVGLVAVAVWLVTLLRAPQLRYLGLFVMIPVIVVMFLAGTVLYAKAQPLVPALQSYWLAIHVSAAATGEGMLMVSAVLSILFLVRRRYDAAVASGAPMRFPVSVGDRLPAAQGLDKSAYRIVAFAFPIYTFGVICGAIWAEAAWGRYWGWDPKETWAFIAWVIYAAYLHARATAGWKGRAAAWINVAGFAAMTFNFFVVNIVISGLHSYAGLN